MSPTDDGKVCEDIRRGARERALSYIAIKERSRYEVEKWLRRKGYSKEETEEALESLTASGLLDDRRLAELIACKAPHRGWGRNRALAEMTSRGIDRETAELALNREYPEDEVAVAMKAALPRWEKMSGEHAARERKLTSWMARNGFATSTIMRVLESIRESEGMTSLP